MQQIKDNDMKRDYKKKQRKEKALTSGGPIITEEQVKEMKDFTQTRSKINKDELALQIQ